MYVAPAETIDTVNVSTNNFDAEQGMAGGASVTVVTKSGTNQVKGSAFEFHNNEGFNATQYFFGTQQGGKPEKLPVTRNIYGGTVGGPIVKNKLFYFGSFEGYKSNQSVFQSFNVPNPALRSGDFSNARNTDGSLQIIYDPSTGNADGTGRAAVPEQPDSSRSHELDHATVDRAGIRHRIRAAAAPAASPATTSAVRNEPPTARTTTPRST